MEEAMAVHANEFRDVVALTLIDSSSLDAGAITPHTKLRIGVRRAERHITHPDIVSVPTQRVPSALADSLLRGWLDTLEIGQMATFGMRWVSNQTQNGHDPIIYAVESLLCTKLGVATALEAGKVVFEASPEICTLNFARYPNILDLEDSPYPAEELLRMTNIRVHITEGVDLFPEDTESYMHSRWVQVANFRKMMDGKDLRWVGLDSFKFCVDGLCVATTNEIVTVGLGVLQPG
jgi:hypothetical protein